MSRRTGGVQKRSDEGVDEIVAQKSLKRMETSGEVIDVALHAKTSVDLEHFSGMRLLGKRGPLDLLSDPRKKRAAMES